MDKRNYCLYRHRNKINGKVYIGITCRTTNHRWGRNGDGYKLQPIFYGAIKNMVGIILSMMFYSIT